MLGKEAGFSSAFYVSDDCVVGEFREKVNGKSKALEGFLEGKQQGKQRGGNEKSAGSKRGMERKTEMREVYMIVKATGRSEVMEQTAFYLLYK